MISEDEQCSLDVEIQSLKAIFAEELEVNRAEDEGGAVQSLVVQMSPESSKGEKQQFVRFEIVLEIPAQYPQAIPKITLRNVRGLSEEAQARTKEYMMNRAEELSGNAMLFELIQVAKEQLTSENTPSIPCSICLFSFDAEDSFSRTPCFHFFHSHCLAKHVQHTFAEKDLSEDKATLTETSKECQQEVLCPVCRLAIPFKESDPEQFPIPRESLREQEEMVITPELREMQKKMAALYSEQLAKGSIIDLEAEKNKFFIEISNTPDIPVLSSTSLSPSQAKPSNDTPATSDGITSKFNAANSQEHLRKYCNGSFKKQMTVNYEKRNLKMQGRKPKETENVDNSAWEEKDESAPTVHDWSQESDRPQRAPPYKQYRRRDGWRSKDRISDDQNNNATAEDSERRTNYQQSDEKRGRHRNQFLDRKFRPKKTDVENEDRSKDDELDETGVKKKNEDESVDDANSRTDNRFNKKKKPRRPKNFDGSATEASAEGVSVKEPECSELTTQDSNYKQHSMGNQHGSTQHNRRYNPRGSYGDSSGQYRNYRQSNYNRGGRRFYSERQQSDSPNEKPDHETAQEDKINSLSNENNADEQNTEARAQSGRNVENRYRNTNYRYKSNIYGKNRYRDSRYNEVQDRNECVGVNEDSNDMPDKGDESSDFPRYQNPRRNNQSGGYRKPRDKFGGRKQNYQDIQSEENYTQKNSETEGQELQNETKENRNYENVHPSRKFQKSHSNESESSEAQKDADSSFSEQTNDRYKYRNKNNNFRKTQNKPGEPDVNLDESGTQEASRQYDADNYRNRAKRRPKYGNNSQVEEEQHDTEPSGTHQEDVPSHYSDTQRDYASNRNWSDSRTNRRDSRNNNYAWKDRSRFPRYHGQHQNRSSMYPVKPEVTAMPSKPDLASLKQTIKPFTSMYNSATQDAQTLVCIPPPF